MYICKHKIVKSYTYEEIKKSIGACDCFACNGTAAWSQTAKEVLTKVFENVEKNYNLADVYKRYDAKYVCFIDGKMKRAFKQDVILNYPKESAKLSEMVWYSNKSFPSKRLRFKELNIDVVRNMYGSFIKDSERFFTSMDSLTLNE